MSGQNQTTHRRLLVIVPAHNEAGSIEAVLDDLRQHAPEADVVVVDDGSTDRTGDLARAGGAKVLPLPCNLGVGGAMQTGYLYAFRNDYDLAVQFDGDGQHRASGIAALLEPIDAGSADLVIGSRLLADGQFKFHPLRFIGSRLLSTLTSLIVRRRITDPTSGFRSASRRAIAFFARHYPQSYLGDTVEALVWAARNGMTIREVAARMRQRTAGQSATGSLFGLVHTLRIILAVLVDCLERRIGEESDDDC